MPVITVEGKSSIFRAAERGTLSITLSTRGSQRAETVKRHNERHNALVALAVSRRDATAATWFQAGRVGTWTYTSTDDGIQHRASSTVEIKYRDFEALAEDVARLAEIDGTFVHVQWALTEDTKRELTAVAQGRAIADATGKGRSYAEAIRPGAQNEISLTRVTEAHLARTNSAVTGSYTRGSAGGSSGQAQITTPDIEVEAAVVAEFVLP